MWRMKNDHPQARALRVALHPLSGGNPSGPAKPVPRRSWLGPRQFRVPYRRVNAMTRRHLTLICIAALALCWAWLPEFTVTMFSYIGLYSMVAAGLVMLTGIGGMTSFGQAAFVAIGAYATAWVCTSPAATAALGGVVPAGALPWVGLA